VTDLDQLLASLDALPAAELPAFLGQLEIAKARALARLTTPAREETRVSGEEAGLLTYADAGAVLGIAPGCVRDLVRRGELASVRVGKKYVRVRPDDLRSYVERHRDPGLDPYRALRMEASHDRGRAASAASSPRPDAGSPRVAPGRAGQLGGTVGARGTRHPRVGGPPAPPPRRATPHRDKVS
jgi:excisionase family DNA binding protein